MRSQILKQNDAVFKIVLGYEYSLSWGFLIAVGIWLLLFFIINPITVSLFGKELIGIIASIAIVSIIGLSGTIRKVVETIGIIASTWWLALIILISIAILIFLAHKLGFNLRATWEKHKENAAKEETSRHRKIIKTGAEAIKKELEDE